MMKKEWDLPFNPVQSKGLKILVSLVRSQLIPQKKSIKSHQNPVNR